MRTIIIDHMRAARFLTLLLFSLACTYGHAQARDSTSLAGYPALVALFEEWRQFETPPDHDGAPDYTRATTLRRHEELKTYQKRLQAIDPGSWPVAQQVDWHLVRAEMNGMACPIIPAIAAQTRLSLSQS